MTSCGPALRLCFRGGCDGHVTAGSARRPGRGSGSQDGGSQYSGEANRYRALGFLLPAVASLRRDGLLLCWPPPGAQRLEPGDGPPGGASRSRSRGIGAPPLWGLRDELHRRESAAPAGGAGEGPAAAAGGSCAAASPRASAAAARGSGGRRLPSGWPLRLFLRVVRFLRFNEARFLSWHSHQFKKTNKCSLQGRLLRAFHPWAPPLRVLEQCLAISPACWNGVEEGQGGKQKD